MKIWHIFFLIWFNVTSCDNTSCANLPNQYDSYDQAISLIKKARFQIKDHIDTGKSGWINGASYYSCDGETGFMIMKFKYREYLFSNVPTSIWEEFKSAESFGKFYNENIKGRYTFPLKPSEIDTSLESNLSIDSISRTQVTVDHLADLYDSGDANAPNDAVKQLLRKSPIKFIKNALKDSLYFSNFRVKVIAVAYEKRKAKLFVQGLFDDGKLLFYCYARFKNEKEMVNDPTFKVISKFKEKLDTVINFMYLQQVDTSKNRLILTVVPMPKDSVKYDKSSYTKKGLVDISHWLLHDVY